MDSMEKFIVQSAIIIATHNVVPMDLAIVDTSDGQRLFSFLSIEWAVIADVDCESEKYRFLGKRFLVKIEISVFYSLLLGEARFTVESIKRILST